MNDRKLSRRRFLGGAAALAGAAAGSSLLAACSVGGGSSGGGGGTRGGSGTLTIMMPPSEVTDEVVAGFEAAHSDIKINLIQFDRTRLTAMLAAGDPPDIARENATYSSFFAVRGLAENLDPYIQNSSVIKESDLTPIQDLWRFDGTSQGQGPRYGLTMDYSQDAMIWANQSIFEKANVAVPSDTDPLAFEELPELAKRLTKITNDEKTAVFGYGGEVNLTMPQLAHMVAAQGGRLYNDDFTAVDFSSPEARKAIQFWLDLARAGVSYGPTRPNPAGWDGSAYQAGRLAMFSAGYWFGAGLAKVPEIQQKSKLLPAPTFAGKRISPSYAGAGVWIPAKAKNKEGAWRFIEYFIGGEAAKKRAESGRGLPPLKSLESSLPHDAPYQKQWYDTQQRELPYFDVVVVGSPYISSASLISILTTEFKSAVSSNTSAGKIADSLNRQINDLIAQEKDKIS